MPASQFYLESRKMPFVRLLIAFIAGILLQWYLRLSLVVISSLFLAGCIGYLSFLFLPAFKVFQLQWLRGICVLVMLAACGGALSYGKNPLHQKDNYTAVYQSGDAVVATVNEALLNKPKTYKANAVINGIYRDKKYIPASGTIIIYFDKAGLDSTLQYGSQIVFTKALQEIKNTGNPGAFNYQRYLLFQGITAQVYLRSKEYKMLPVNQGSSFTAFIQNTQRYLIHTLQTYIPGKKEQGVAEALLIGYRNDLDKQLVQSYSNTGVVHIIAISGLHLGMIYGLILLLFSPFKNRRWYRFVVPSVAILILWLFTLLAGAVPSILRSAVTFSFIAFGMFINRKGSIYNTLAASAFCLLLANPYLLWDVGFQLSYAAVLSIGLFARPIYNSLYFQNKLLNKIWLATCITLAAQILTLPVVLYNFHQFPAAFLITNLLVVFLSEIILFALLFLIVIGKWIWASTVAGKLIQSMLWLMNTVIERTEKLPFSLWVNIKTDVVQAWLLYAIIILLAAWLLYKLPRLFIYGFVLSVVFLIYTSIDIFQTNRQQKLIVYNIPKHNAVDIISRRKATCLFDANLPGDITANSFTIKPSHTLFRINNSSNYILSSQMNLSFQAHNKTVLIISHALPAMPASNKLKADVVIITSNPKLYISDVYKSVSCQTIVADNNTSFWKINKWKQDCDRLHIQFHSVSQQGAFVMDL